MIETVDAPRFRRSDFAAAGKKPGLSAIVRLRNEEDFAAPSLHSILPHFDEIVIVFGGCTDRTAEIVAEFAKKYPAYVKAFHYVPEVFPQGSSQHARLPPNSVHSLVHYNNFALSKATYRICCKWDGDQIADPDAFGEVVQRLRTLRRGTIDWLFSPWKWGYWWCTGLNLWDHDDKLFVPKGRPLAGRAHDLGFFPAGRSIVFKRYAQAEYLFTRFLVHKYIGCLFFHVKGMKRDRGIGVYQLDQNPDSWYKQQIERNWANPQLQSLDELRVKLPEIRRLSNPLSLGIVPIVSR